MNLEADDAGVHLVEHGLLGHRAALAEQPDVDREGVQRLERTGSMCQDPGVTVVAVLPSAGPVPPPMSVVTPAASASSICSGQMKWTWVSIPPAVRILPLPEMTSVLGADDEVGGLTGRCRCG